MSSWARRRLHITAVFLSLACPLAPAWAGAIWLYEVATPDQGTAAAGRAALAVDASTAWLNPAGMTRLDQSQLLLGADPSLISGRVDIAVYAGHVVLVGVVNSQATVDKYVAEARSVSGVVSVTSFIQTM